MTKVVSMALSAALFSAACLAQLAPATAHTTIPELNSGNTLSLIEQSNLIFVGTVLSVQYTKSVASKTSVAVPFTLVTYQISKVLRGKSPGKTITLRFIGGSDGQGRFMQAEGVPNFEAGHKDIMFLAGNGGDNSCPLVFCEAGRYRIFENAVYDYNGTPVFQADKRRINASGQIPDAFRKFSFPRPDFDELIKNPDVQVQIEKLGRPIEDLRADYEKFAPTSFSFADTNTPPKGSDSSRISRPSPTGDQNRKPIALDAFAAVIVAGDGSVKPARSKVVSVDPKAQITFAPTVSLRPPKTPTTTANASSLSAQDAAELKALADNGGNPVLPR
ncbi:hypothetical protein [Oryzibacter oryziterrae]|uniref:hypothetical protein n=1 Tax=Oryzibacter oryziterrae TaxID=2766474 RepID=UPI001F19A398|nr:hypothetical protein [Oryzibacter oryziterrae]